MHPVSFFAPHCRYSSCSNPLAPLDEFRDMVKALHRAGIEVILDVVYNHTAEGGDGGPTLSFRGLENSAYYIMDADGQQLLQLRRNRQHPQCQPVDRASSHPGQPPLLGARNARRWVSLRSCVDSVSRRGRPADPQPAGPLGHRVGPGPGRHQAHRRSLGRSRSLPGWSLHRRQLERVERTVSRRRAGFRARRREDGPPSRQSTAGQPGPLRQ